MQENTNNKTKNTPEDSNRSPDENAPNGQGDTGLASYGPSLPPPPDTVQARPAIIISDRQDRELIKDLNDALQAANVPPKLFDTEGKLSEIDSGSLRPVTANRLMLYITMAADIYIVKNKARRAAPPPRRLANSLLSVGASELGYPPLRGIINTPVHRNDGTLVQIPGYDADSGLFYQPAEAIAAVRIPANPSREDAVRARDVLYDLLTDFKFQDEASRANFLGALIAPVLRESVAGHLPLFAVRAQSPSCGKTTLCDTLGFVYQGGQLERNIAPQSNSAEWEKKLFGMLLERLPFALFDNANHEVESEFLAQVLTSEKVRSRVLRTSITLTAINRTMFLVNGNAELTAGENLARRTIWIFLEKDAALQGLRTEERQWAHSPYGSYILGNRTKILRAILTMTSAWFAAGSPSSGGPVIDSFEPLSRTLGGVLEFSGVPSFLGNYRQMVLEAERDMEVFLLSAHELLGSNSFTTKVLLEKVQTIEPLIDAVPPKFRNSIGDPVALGKALRKIYGRPFGESRVRLERKGENRNGVMMWQIVVPAI